ncbi:unnamed protein product, partial [Ectocarpus sp. 13 AM-2016]
DTLDIDGSHPVQHVPQTANEGQVHDCFRTAQAEDNLTMQRKRFCKNENHKAPDNPPSRQSKDAEEVGIHRQIDFYFVIAIGGEALQLLRAPQRFLLWRKNIIGCGGGAPLLVAGRPSSRFLR